MSNLVAIAYDDMSQAQNADLPAGGAAVVVLVQDATRDKVVPEISKYGGRVIQSSLSNEQQEALRDALDKRGAAV